MFRIHASSHHRTVSPKPTITMIGLLRILCYLVIVPTWAVGLFAIGVAIIEAVPAVCQWLGYCIANLLGHESKSMIEVVGGSGLDGGMLAFHKLPSAYAGPLFFTIAIAAFTVSSFLTNILSKTSQGSSNNCKQCKRGSKIISERKRYIESTKTLTRRHTRHNNAGDETGYTETEYEAPWTYSHTYYTHKCKSCGHEWEDSSNESKWASKNGAVVTSLLAIICGLLSLPFVLTFLSQQGDAFMRWASIPTPATQDRSSSTSVIESKSAERVKFIRIVADSVAYTQPLSVAGKSFNVRSSGVLRIRVDKDDAKLFEIINNEHFWQLDSHGKRIREIHAFPPNVSQLEFRSTDGDKKYVEITFP